jgi:hypothetical protein
MNKDHGFPALSDFVGLVLANARGCVPEEERAEDVRRIDPATVSPGTPVELLLREQLENALASRDANAVGAYVQGAVDGVCEALTGDGVVLRHPRVWFKYPVEVVHAQVLAMRYRNQQIRTEIGEEDVLLLFRQDGEDVSPDEIETRADFQRVFAKFFTIDEKSPTPFADCFRRIIDKYYLTFSAEELQALDHKRTMSGVYAMLTQKLRERQPNDGLVQYGRMYSLQQRKQTYDFIDRVGGTHNVPSGLGLKHISKLFNILSDNARSSHGVTARVPDEARIGELEDAPGAMRVYLRGDSGVFFNYPSFESMLDDGWVLD